MEKDVRSSVDSSRMGVEARFAIASAACAISGQDEPLSPEIDDANRIYFYAVPATDMPGSLFSVERLMERMGDSGLRHGVEWDRNHEKYGLRFVEKMTQIPASLIPFIRQDAKADWVQWVTYRNGLKVAVEKAASETLNNPGIDFEDRSLTLSQRDKQRSKVGPGER